MLGKSQARLLRARGEESGRETIMDAAERLFAERGIEAVSLRTINAEAGYSVAALHYHFATRDGLVRALLARAQPPMLQQHAALLAQLARQHDPSLEAIVEALVRPLTAGMLQNFPVSIARLRFLVRQSFDHSPHLAKTLEESVAVFRPLLRRKLPHLDQRTLTRRWLLAAELAQQTLANTLTLHLACPPATGPKEAELEQFIKDLVAFIAAGLRAPL
jgi:AcrR family transcriptional regulator